MHHHTDTGRDRLDLLPRDAWPEPWRSMDAGGPPLRPNDIPDPEALPPPAPMLVPVLDVGAPYRAALEQLGANLRGVNEVWQAKRAKGAKAYDRQMAAYGSVKAASDFLKAILPDGHYLTVHLDAILIALSNLPGGRVADWLMPTSYGGRPAGVGDDVGTWRGRYASIVELLHRQGRSIRDAARDVKKMVPDHSPVWGSGTPSWEAIKRWRDYDCKVEGSAEKEAYESGLAFAERFPLAGPMEILRRMPQVGV